MLVAECTWMDGRQSSAAESRIECQLQVRLWDLAAGSSEDGDAPDVDADADAQVHSDVLDASTFAAREARQHHNVNHLLCTTQLLWLSVPLYKMPGVSGQEAAAEPEALTNGTAGAAAAAADSDDDSDSDGGRRKKRKKRKSKDKGAHKISRGGGTKSSFFADL